MYRYISNFIILLLCCSFNVINAQKNKTYYTYIGAESLRSTHGNFFWGVTADINKRISPKVDLGLGVEYSASPKHLDNGWNLYKVKLLPVYFQQNINLIKLKNTDLFIHLQEGFSFISYDKEWQNNLGYNVHIHEGGFYGFGGVGIKNKINKKLMTKFVFGLKSFHLSTNELEVNPHGLAVKLGVGYQL